jgi:competence protein ComEC
MGGAPALVATLLGLPAWFLLSAIVGIVEATASLPFASATLEPPWNVVGGLTTALVPAVVVGARRRLRSAPRTPAHASSLVTPPTVSQHRPASRGRARPMVVAALAVSLVSVGLAVAHRPDGSTKVTVLDIGQGDAILVEGGRGGRMLVDGGPDPDRLLIELDERLPPWDRRIDVVVLTHPHEDHVAGLALLLARYRIGRVFEPGMHGPGPGYAAWDAELAAVGAPERGLLVTGDRLAVDDLQFDVLWPDPGRAPREPPDGGRSINDVSIVLLGEVGGRRILLTGDVEDDVDPLLAARGLPPIDFLKVAHHGSGTASTVAFLGVVRPAVAVVSAGADNPYGHPARSTLDNLAATGAAVFRTDTDGSVEAVFADGGMTVRASGARAADAGPRLAATGASRAAFPAFSCAVPSSG